MSDESRFGPGIAFNLDDEGLRENLSALRRSVERRRVEVEYLELFDEWLRLRERLRQFDH